MSCAERKDMILLYAFDQLEPEEAASLVAHVRDGCPRCVGELAAARTIAGHVALGVPPVTPPAAVKERVLARIAGSSVVSFAGARASAPPRVSARWPAMAAVALVAASVASVAILIPARRGVDALRGELATARDAARALETRAATAEATLRSLGSPATRMVSLEATGPQFGGSGRVFWDESKGTWHLFVANMKPTGPGRTYELWYVTADKKAVPAATFDVGAGGEASLELELPKDLGPIALAAVTEEPAGGVPQPTGAIQLVGKLGA